MLHIMKTNNMPIICMNFDYSSIQLKNEMELINPLSKPELWPKRIPVKF